MYSIFFLIFIIIPPLLALVDIAIVDTANNTNGLFFYYLKNSILLTTSVTVISTIIGTITAYIVTFFDFRWRLVFQLALILPVAIPSYISALSYSYALEFAGPIQTFLRHYLNINIAPYFNIRSMGGCIFIMSISSFPYVYITSMNAMYKTKHLVHVARTFNKKFTYIFFKIIIPVCKKQIVSGSVLVLMEVLSDFATCQMLAVDTINNAIYKGWFLTHNPPYAARISLFILVISMIILYIKKECVKNYRIDKIKSQNLYYKLSEKNNLYINCLIIIIILLSFIFPLLPLIKWSFIPASVDINLIKITKNTLLITVITAIITTLISFLLAINKKNNFSFFCQIGFSLPKSVVSIGMISFFTIIHKLIPKIILVGTLSGIVYAYIFAFTALSFNSINTEFRKIPKYIEMLIMAFNLNSLSNKIKIYLPLLKKSFIISFLISFVEISKEISIILILRPFNFSTISIKTFDLFMDERYKDAAKPALILVIISMILVIILITSIYKKQKYDIMSDK